MSGGFGKRLRPVTENIPKPMVPIVSEPCINHIVNLLDKYGINDIAVTTMYKGDIIKENLEKNYPGKNIKFFEENNPLGTAGSVSAARDFLDGDFLVISGDAVCDLDIESAVGFHRKKNGIATVILSERDDPTEYGIVLTDDNDEIVKFIEKPDWSRACSNNINTGIYIFSDEIFKYIPGNGFSDFSKDIFPCLLENGVKIYAAKMDFYWKDIGSFDCYLEANSDMLKGKIQRLNNKENHIAKYKNSKIIPPCFIDDDCIIEDAEIGPNTVIGKGCRIKRGARISDSVLMENVVVGNDSYVRRAIICNNTEVGKNVAVGEESVVGSGCKIGDGSIVSSGTVIYNNIAYDKNSRISGRNFTLRKTEEIKSGKIVFDNYTTLFDILRWGYSYGNTVDGNIAFAFPEKAYSVFAQTLSSAVRDSGDNVYLLCETDFSGLKYIVRNFGFQGGIYLHKENENIVLNFIDEDGLFITSDKVKKMEKIYRSGDFETGKGGKLKVFNGFAVGYGRHIERLFRDITPFSISVTAPSSIMFFLPFSEKNANEKFFITDERIRIFYSENGEEKEYSKTAVSLVCLYVFGKLKKKVFIPEVFPDIAEKIAEDNNFEVRRISWDSADRYLLYDFTDPVTSASYLFRYISSRKTSFGEILKKLPDIYREEEKIEVGGGEKARILSSITKNTDCSLLENGIKIYIPDKNSIVSVLSSADKRSFRIYAESVHQETAKELCDIYVNKIKNESKSVKKDTSG